MRASTRRNVLALVLALAILQPLFAAAAPAASQDDDSCRLKAREAKDCSLCCAIGGFNKFDSQRFQSGKGCYCFKDEAEIALNQRHRPRKP